MRIINDESTVKEIKHYRGSLDFPCHFCDKNSYDNYHFKINYSVYFVVCSDCLKKVLRSDKE